MKLGQRMTLERCEPVDTTIVELHDNLASARPSVGVLAHLESGDNAEAVGCSDSHATFGERVRVEDLGTFFTHTSECTPRPVY